MEHSWYTVADIASFLRLHPKTVTRFIHEGKIPARKIGRAWMVSKEDFRAYAHGELADGENTTPLTPPAKPLEERISVSAVVEIDEHDSQESARISNSILAMLNGRDIREGGARFDALYYPETRKAKYVICGPASLVAGVLQAIEALSAGQKE